MQTESGRSEHSRLLGASLLVVTATTSGSVANFLFQWIAARRLDPGSFSVLAAMLAVVTLAVLPGPPLSIPIVRRLAARRPGEPAPRLGNARWAGIVVGLGILAAIAVVSSIAGDDRLHLAGSGGPYLWLAALVITVSMLAIFPDLARIQAAGRFGRYGTAHALLSATRLGFGGGALLAGAGPLIALCLIIPGPWLVRGILPRADRGAPELEGRWMRELLPALAATGGLHALVVLDVIFARVHFGESDPIGAGGYAACATLARALYHLPFAATAVTVRGAAAAAAAGRPTRGILFGNLGLVTALVAVGALLLFLWPTEILAIFAGSGKYESQGALLQRLLIPMALASLAAGPAHYLLALGHRAPVWILGIAPWVLGGLLARRPETPADLVPPLIAVQGAVTVALLIFAIGASRSRVAVGPASAAEQD